MNRQADDTPGGVSHQTAHTGQLGNRAKTALGRAGMRHGGQVSVGVHGLAHRIGNDLGRLLPDFDDAFVAFLLGQKTAAEGAVDIFYILLRFARSSLSSRRDGDIRHRDGRTGAHGILKTDIFDRVSHFGGDILTAQFVYIRDQVFDAAFIQDFIDELDFRRQNAVEKHPANRGVE